MEPPMAAPIFVKTAETTEPMLAAAPIAPLRTDAFRIITPTEDSKQSVNGSDVVMRIDDFQAETADIWRAERPLAVVDGWPVNLANLEQATSAIISAAKNGQSFSAVTLNLDHLVKLRSSAAFRRAYRHASFVTADGEPVAKLARRQNGSIVRTTGADLVVPLARAAANAGIPVYLFGTSPDVIARAGSYLAQASGAGRELDLAGSTSPGLDFDPEGPEADAALDRIAASGAKLCFVALGAPKQELFSARAVARGVSCGFVNIGAALDFLAGAQVRAPLIMQRSGLEWLWRLASSPRRLAGRYLSCALVLADIVLLGPQTASGAPYRMGK
jgi:exopolysaccharide biosynthesis WecB/TagA/CpsF family protein